MAENTLTRIYQGRVNQVRCANKELSFDEGQDILWKHHELYQDAVNYYLVALAGMADPKQEKSPCAKFRAAMEKTWDGFGRNGVSRPGMKESLARTLQCDVDKLTFQDAVNKILRDNQTSIEVLHAGLQNIAGNLKGNVVQAAGRYSSQLCYQRYNGSYDNDGKSNAGRDGMKKMLDLLHTTDVTEAQRKFESIKDKMQLTWVGQKTLESCYTVEKLKGVAKEMIEFFLETKKDSSTPVELANAIDVETLTALRGRLGEITRADIQKIGTGTKIKTLTYAALLLISFGDLSLLKIIHAQRKALEQKALEQKALEKKKKKWGDADGGENALPDDPIKMARGERGYVFLYFTRLPIWNDQWKEFDKEAFVEALKTLNQFQDKIEKRQEKLDKVKQCIDWMHDGISADGKPPELPADDSDGGDDGEETDEGSGTLPILKDDPRWIRLQTILQDRLKIQNDLTNGEIVEYGLSKRSIRGAGPIFKEWNEIRKRGGVLNLEKELRDVLARYQKENFQTIGSAPLFLELTKAENHCIWDSGFQNTRRYASRNILEDAVTYYKLCEDAEFLDEPIKFTPADARYSRRLSNFKKLSGQKQKKEKGRMTWGTGFGLLDSNQLNVPVAMRRENGKWAKEKVTLTYSAPRLLRDQLVRGDHPIYCPPLAQAFNVFDGPVENSSGQAKKIASALRDSAVQFMPDYDRKGKLRLLLNFQPSVNVEEVRKNSFNVFPEKFFYGVKDEKFRLKWPDYDKPQPLWCDSSQAFDIVSVDLGQRSAGALSRLRVSTDRQDRAIFIGNDGKWNWFAKQVYGGLLRLPGEDCAVVNGKEELSGSAGRLATAEETEEAKAIATEILGNPEVVQDFLVVDMAATGELIYRKYFPDQNDALLRILKRGIYRLRQLARWHFFWKNGEEAKVLDETKAAPWLSEKNLIGIQKAELQLRDTLKTNLLRITERILPLRGRHWELKNVPQGGMVLSQTTPSSLEPERWICGQRGLSFARLEQLENLRRCFQSVNRILMEAPGAKRKTARELREISIPDCCPDILMRLDALKEQRVNQTANMILAQALGLRHKEHDAGTRGYREENNIHGEYEQIPGLVPAKFIVIENLSRYRFSQGRSRFENSRLMKWSHRAIRDKLKMLCEVYGITVVEVNAGYSSIFSPGGVPGFRAEELHWKDVRRKFFFYKSVKVDFPAEEKELKRQLELLIAEAKRKNKTILLPRDGGPIFVPFRSENDDRRLSQADVNASFNLGLRALAHVKVLTVHHKLSIEKTKGVWKLRNFSKLVKKLLPKSAVFEIGTADQPHSDFSNIFVCGCPCREFGQTSAQTEGEFEEYNGRMMVGGSIWQDRILKLKRCLAINRKRLS